MKTHKHIEELKELITKYHQGKTNSKDERILFEYFGSDKVDPELEEYTPEFRPFCYAFEKIKPSPGYVERILKDTVEAKNERVQGFDISVVMKIAASVAIITISFLAGFFVNDFRKASQTSSGEILYLKSELKEIKETMISNFLNQQLNHQKLLALTMASQMDSINGMILNKVLMTINHDENVNIRLAAAGILSQFANDRAVQDGIISSLPHQNSPLVLFELTRIIKTLDEETSKKLYDQIMRNDNLEDSLKSEIAATYKSI